MKGLLGSAYVVMITHCREVYTRHGSQLLYPLANEINAFFKSTGGGIEFTFFNTDGLSSIQTPDGLISPLGNRVGGNEEAALDELIQYYGLEIIRDSKRHGEQHTTYRATKNLP